MHQLSDPAARREAWRAIGVFMLPITQIALALYFLRRAKQEGIA